MAIGILRLRENAMGIGTGVWSINTLPRVSVLTLEYRYRWSCKDTAGCLKHLGTGTGHRVYVLKVLFDQSFSGVLAQKDNGEMNAHVALVENPTPCYNVCCNNHSQANAVQVSCKFGPEADSWVVDSGATHHITSDATKVLHSSDYTGPEERWCNDVEGCCFAFRVRSVFSGWCTMNAVDFHDNPNLHEEGSQNRVASDDEVEMAAPKDDVVT
ncbi:hypothetical protein V6N13_125285 [Hibiscus sabdariffa]